MIAPPFAVQHSSLVVRDSLSNSSGTRHWPGGFRPGSNGSASFREWPRRRRKGPRPRSGSTPWLGRWGSNRRLDRRTLGLIDGELVAFPTGQVLAVLLPDLTRRK